MNSFFQLSLNSTESLIDNRLTENIQSGISFLKEGISNAFDKTTGRINQHIVNPVNNFLKDFPQMENEFKRVQESDSEFRLCLNGNYVSANDILQMPMEENY